MEEDHAPQNEGDHDGGAEIRLLDDKGHRHEPHGRNAGKALPAERLAVLGQQARAQQEDGDFGELRGLDAHGTEGDPALGAVDRCADEGHEQEQDERDDVEGPGHGPELAVVEAHDGHHAGQAAQAPDGLLLVEVGERRAGAEARSAGRVEVDLSDEEEGQGEEDKAPVDVGDERFLFHGF